MIKRLLEFYRRTRGPIVTGNGVVSTWASTILRQPHVRKMIEVGGGTTNIGSGSGDKTPSPDWDVKWPDGDGKANDFTGI